MGQNRDYGQELSPREQPAKSSWNDPCCNGKKQLFQASHSHQESLLWGLESQVEQGNPWTKELEAASMTIVISGVMWWNKWHHNYVILIKSDKHITYLT